MENYLFTNIIISFLILVNYALLNNAPARLRFYLMVTALFSWLVPWQKVLINLPINNVLPTQVITYSQEILTFISLDVNNVSISPLDKISATLTNNTHNMLHGLMAFLFL